MPIPRVSPSVARLTFTIYLQCIPVGASVNARDHRRQTPLHIVAEEYEEDLLQLLLENNADTGLVDVDGSTPLDIAAREQWVEGFDILLSHTVSSRRDDQAKKSLKKAMDGPRTRDDFVSEQLEEMSPFRCAGLIVVPGRAPLLSS